MSDQWKASAASTPEAAGAEPETPSPVTEATSPVTEPATTGWVGWVYFAGVMMALLGAFQIIEGLTALFNRTYLLVTSNGVLVHANLAAWGWTHLIIGVIALVAGFEVMMGQMWARVVGIILAGLSAVLNLAYIAAYPLWSMIIIAIDIIVIYALAVHGGELKER
jgi:hypothetical protein